MSEFKERRIKDAIKSALKKEKLTYDQVAAHLGCSVPTVKRILGEEEIGLHRLLELCELLNLTLADLEQLSKQETEASREFTEEQEKFLATHPHHLNYLMKLFDGMSPQAIADKYQLSPRSTDKYLIALEKMDLIKVSGSLKVRPKMTKSPSFGTGLLAQTYYERLIKAGAQFFIETIKDGLLEKKTGSPKSTAHPIHRYSLLQIKVTPSSYEKWAKEQLKLYQEIERVAEYEAKAYSEDQLKTAILVEATTLVPNDQRHLRIFETAMGEIKNL